MPHWKTVACLVVAWGIAGAVIAWRFWPPLSALILLFLSAVIMSWRKMNLED